MPNHYTDDTLEELIDQKREELEATGKKYGFNHHKTVEQSRKFEELLLEHREDY